MTGFGRKGLTGQRVSGSVAFAAAGHDAAPMGSNRSSADVATGLSVPDGPAVRGNDHIGRSAGHDSKSGELLPQSAGAKSAMLAYLLWWFGAVFAAHRLYLGAYRSAAALAGLFWGGLALGAFMSHQSSLQIGGIFVPPFWALMILAWLLWSLIDLLLIPGIARRAIVPRLENGIT